MKDKKRIKKTLKKINKIWKTRPDLRFFQLLEYIKVKMYKVSEVDSYSADLFYFEDQKFLNCLDEIIKEKNL